MTLGPYLHSLEVAKLANCAAEIKSDTSTFGIDCIKHLLDVTEVVVAHQTEQERLRQDALATFNQRGLLKGKDNADVLVIVNATLVTMNHGREKKDIVREGVIVVRGGVFDSVGKGGEVKIPEGATILDAHGGKNRHSSHQSGALTDMIAYRFRSSWLH